MRRRRKHGLHWQLASSRASVCSGRSSNSWSPKYPPRRADSPVTTTRPGRRHSRRPASSSRSAEAGSVWKGRSTHSSPPRDSRAMRRSTSSSSAFPPALPADRRSSFWWAERTAGNRGAPSIRARGPSVVTHGPRGEAQEPGPTRAPPSETPPVSPVAPLLGTSLWFIRPGAGEPPMRSRAESATKSSKRR